MSEGEVRDDHSGYGVFPLPVAYTERLIGGVADYLLPGITSMAWEMFAPRGRGPERVNPAKARPLRNVEAEYESGR